MGSKTKVKKRKAKKRKKLKNLIITACDERFGDFVADNWLASLKDTVDLSNTDVVILDYGFSDEQREKLKGARVIKCKNDGNVTVLRFRDAYKVLESKKYNQVLIIDGGDIIFQADLKEAFEKDRDTFRAMIEMISMPYRVLYLYPFFRKKDISKINQFLNGKKLVNIGVILGPANKMKKLCKGVYDLIKNKHSWGPDTIAVNYIMQKEGFKNLDETYNFVITVSRQKFIIRNSVFYLKSGEKIAIVHNAGGREFFRTIEDFGYGPGHNKLRKISFFLQRYLITVLDNLFNKVRRSPIKFK